MKNTQPHRIRTISEYHQLKGLPKPEHPLVSVIHLDETQQLTTTQNIWVFDFYSIALKRNFDSKVKYKYGQQTYDLMKVLCFLLHPIRFFQCKQTKIINFRDGCYSSIPISYYKHLYQKR